MWRDWLIGQWFKSPVVNRLISYRVSKLVQRVKVQTSPFFCSGLLTNDVHRLDTSPCLYSFMLSNLGRIVADLFLFRFAHKPHDCFIDVGSLNLERFMKYLKVYKIRRKVSFRICPDKSVWAVYPTFPETVADYKLKKSSEQAIVVSDPRHHSFGFRILGQDFGETQDCISAFENLNQDGEEFRLKAADLDNYRTFRYRNGLAEGGEDFGIESLFPFEANAEFFNAISFDKGCYVGQELTARTYHTGVIRKRFLPVVIIDPRFSDEQVLSKQNVINADSGRTVGRFLVNFGPNGIASLKHADVLPRDESPIRIRLSESDYEIQTYKPHWWPESFSFP